MPLRIQQYLLFAALILLPLTIDMVIWRAIVVPQQVKYRELARVHALIKQKPELESLLREANEQFDKWMVRGFMAEDGGAFKEIQRSAAVEGVLIREIHVKGSEVQASAASELAAVPFLQVIPFELDARGNFLQLMRWMSSVENNPGLKFRNFTLDHDQENGVVLRATLDMLVKRK